MGNVGVITEQGYPAGQFGFDKLNEADQEKLEKANQKETSDQSSK